MPYISFYGLTNSVKSGINYLLSYLEQSHGLDIYYNDDSFNRSDMAFCVLLLLNPLKTFSESMSRSTGTPGYYHIVSKILW